jgi:NADH-quinone oxidoreductase subunit N
MNLAAFATIIAVGRSAGSGQRGETLAEFAGLGSRQPWLAAAMTLVMLSLAGMPPLAGFWAKLWIFGAAVQAGLVWLAVVGVLNSVVSAYYYLRVVSVMYLRRDESAAPEVTPVHQGLWIGLILGSVAIVALGIWPTPLLELAQAALLAWLGA